MLAAPPVRLSLKRNNIDHVCITRSRSVDAAALFFFAAKRGSDGGGTGNRDQGHLVHFSADDDSEGGRGGERDGGRGGRIKHHCRSVCNTSPKAHLARATLQNRTI